MKKEPQKLKADVKKAETLGRGWMYKPAGKLILEKVITMKMPWPEITTLLSRHKATVEKAFSFWNIQKPRPEFINWDVLEVRDLVREYYLKKSPKAKNPRESSQLSLEMWREVNKERQKHGLDTVTLNAIRCFAKSSSMGHLRWGFCFQDGKPDLSRREEMKLRKHYETAPVLRLNTLLENRSRGELVKCARSLELRRKNSPYSWEEECILRKAVMASRSIQNDEEFYRLMHELEKQLPGRPYRGMTEKIHSLGLEWHYQPSRGRRPKEREDIPVPMWQP